MTDPRFGAAAFSKPVHRGCRFCHKLPPRKREARLPKERRANSRKRIRHTRRWWLKPPAGGINRHHLAGWINHISLDHLLSLEFSSRPLFPGQPGLTVRISHSCRVSTTEGIIYRIGNRGKRDSYGFAVFGQTSQFWQPLLRAATGDSQTVSGSKTAPRANDRKAV